MKYLLIHIFSLLPLVISAQKEAITTLSSILYDGEVQLNQKNKKTHSNLIPLEISHEIWNQFEKIDAVFISAWAGNGLIAKEQYKSDIRKIDSKYKADPIIYFAEKAPGFFNYPRKQAGFGTEIVIMEYEAESNCIRKYNKRKIAPKGVFPCVIHRNYGTTPVNFFYRNAIPKQYYSSGKCKGFNLLLRTSSKSDTVKLDTKIVLTIMGKRLNTSKSISMDKFLEEAIYNGMKQDGFPLNHARWIVENVSVFFVTKCPICRPVQRGIERYIDNYEDSIVKISNELLDPIALGKVEEKQLAFSKIVNKYVDKYFESSKMNEREITAMRSKLEEARKKGMALKSQSFGPFCPSCDGACKIQN